MELRHLRYFVAVADELHFGRAARTLGIAQPPLSQQIQRFERTLGVQLFSRTRRNVQLTPAGAALLPEAREILARADRALALVRDTASGRLGRLSVGFVGSASLTVLPDLVAQYRAVRPGVDLELLELSTEEQFLALDSGQIQAGCVRVPFNPDSECELLLLREPLILALPQSLAADLSEPLPVSAVAGAPFIVSPQRLGHRFHEQIRGVCRRAGFTPNVVQEAIQMQTTLGLVAAGIGVALVPASLARLGRREVVFRTLLDSEAYTDLVLVWKDSSNPLVHGFVEVARAISQVTAHSAQV